MNNDFNGQVALITGACSGLGLAISRKLFSLGATLVMLDKNAEEIHNTNLLIKENIFYPVDIRNEHDVKQVIDAVGHQFGRIDILVNSAGVTGKKNIKSHEVSSDNLSMVFDINFMGSFYTSKYAIPWMLKNNYGRILHIASIAGKEGNAGMLAYSASKSAVIGMTKVQGKDYAETGITVNALAPAVIKTHLLDDMPDAQVKYMTDKIPMKRCGTLDEVANLASYIVSPQNSFTTGFVFDLSGGRATY